MSASALAKKHGFKSLKEVSELTEWSVDVLTLWHKDKPERFKLVLVGLKIRELDLNTKHFSSLSAAIELLEKAKGKSFEVNNLRALRYLLCTING